MRWLPTKPDRWHFKSAILVIYNTFQTALIFQLFLTFCDWVEWEVNKFKVPPSLDAVIPEVDTSKSGIAIK
ncbi:hypothetical protein Cflav_PD5777 [Pedosphaera parvula Ellin514]|uniref:Uncharacterized protein n=1 Tax=Pedosphaera parvula (strain Ellin514) TaxID=320771 RepID=B9XAV7_PEDPL|nr:hypothetical protein Cflav_PD5777 [Pedosphaera parvula Ellin514]